MKLTALSASAMTFALALVPTGHAGPLPTSEGTTSALFIDLSNQDFNSTANDLTPRSGDVAAYFYNGGSCSGNWQHKVSDFGCSKTCYTGFSAASVLLTQEYSNNPKPTTSLYSSGDCTGSYQSIGILSGQTTGCTNYAGTSSWQSAHLYIGC